MSAPKIPFFSKLLVCTDNSPSSPGVVNTGLELARLTSAKLRLLEVVMSPLYPDQLPTSLEQVRAREEEVRARLESRPQFEGRRGGGFTKHLLASKRAVA